MLFWLFFFPINVWPLLFDIAYATTYDITEADAIMSKFYILLQKIRSMDKNLRFDELRKILEFYDYVMDGPANGSSHKTFRKREEPL